MSIPPFRPRGAENKAQWRALYRRGRESAHAEFTEALDERRLEAFRAEALTYEPDREDPWCLGYDSMLRRLFRLHSAPSHTGAKHAVSQSGAVSADIRLSNKTVTWPGHAVPGKVEGPRQPLEPSSNDPTYPVRRAGDPRGITDSHNGATASRPSTVSGEIHK
jgi:hypothetical protein